MTKLISFLAIAVFSASAFAGKISVEDRGGQFVVKTIEATGVKGINLVLALQITRDDCNQRSMQLTSALVDGSGDGWYDTYFLNAGVVATEMFCPLKTPIVEWLRSKAVTVKAFNNPHVKDTVKVSVIVPAGFELEVTELK